MITYVPFPIWTSFRLLFDFGNTSVGEFETSQYSKSHDNVTSVNLCIFTAGSERHFLCKLRSTHKKNKLRYSFLKRISITLVPLSLSQEQSVRPYNVDSYSLLFLSLPPLTKIHGYIYICLTGHYVTKNMF